MWRQVSNLPLLPGKLETCRHIGTDSSRGESIMTTIPTPLVRLSNLFPHRQVWAKCEHLARSGSFKIRGTIHLLERLSQESRTRELVVPSMGNTALGVAVGARDFGFRVVG